MKKQIRLLTAKKVMQMLEHNILDKNRIIFYANAGQIYLK